MNPSSQGKTIFTPRNWFLIVAPLCLLSLGVFAILKIAIINQPVHGGFGAELLIYHREPQGFESNETMIAVMRHGMVFRHETRQGFWGLYGRCRGYRSGVPDEWPVQRLRKVIESPQLQVMEHSTSLSPGNDGWYVKARVGKGVRCWKLTEQEMHSKEEVRPLLAFFETVKGANESLPIDPYNCGGEIPVSFDNCNEQIPH